VAGAHGSGVPVMHDFTAALKSLDNAGIAGFLIYLIYRLVDKWAPKFLDAQQKTAEAMLTLAGSVKDGQGEQREMAMAIRVLSTEIGDVKGMLRELVDGKKGA